MKLIEWTESLSVGILEIDQQHKKLIMLLNKATETILSGNPREYIISNIKEIINYTSIHFSAEEKMFKICRYEHAKKHIEDHQKMLGQANTFLNEYISNKICITESTMNFFTDWIINHITQSDMKYSKPLKAAGYK